MIDQMSSINMVKGHAARNAPSMHDSKVAKYLDGNKIDLDGNKNNNACPTSLNIPMTALPKFEKSLAPSIIVLYLEAVLLARISKVHVSHLDLL